MLTLLSSLSCMGKGKESADTVTARRAFIEMPSGTLDLLPRDTRLDMLDYYDNDSIYRAPNNMRGTSFLQAVTPDFLSVQLTPVSSLQIKVHRMTNGREILMTIYTTGTESDSADSEIAFYDADLNPLPADRFFPTPKLSDFFDTKGYKTKMKEIEEILPFHAIVYTAAPGSDSVTGRLTYNDLLTVEDAHLIELFLKPSVNFIWNGKQYKIKP